MKSLLVEVSEYYSAKLAEFGDTPSGVDWNSQESQILRFEQLAKLIKPISSFTLNDLGCGYGALFDYLASNYPQFAYVGCDVCPDMIQSATARHAKHPNARFAIASNPTEMADYSVASGIFNVRLGHGDGEWLDYIKATLEVLDRYSLMGFAFNCLTAYSDADKMRDYLYYANPCELFDYCKRRYSRHVALLHDYGLYEFTLLVRKQL